MHALACNYYLHFLNLMVFCPAIPNQLIKSTSSYRWMSNHVTLVQTGLAWAMAGKTRQSAGEAEELHSSAITIREALLSLVVLRRLKTRFSFFQLFTTFYNFLPRLWERALIDLFGTLVPRRLCWKSKFLPPFHAREFRTIGLAGVG